MWKKCLMLGAALLFLSNASMVSHATETVSGGQSGQEAANDQEQSSETGTYIPYEGAKYSLTYRVTDSGIVITGITDCVSDLGELLIPAEINGVAVTTIGERAFMGHSSLRGSLVISEGVTTIGEMAFMGCSGFTGSLVIPEGVTTIGGNAFSYCSGFTGDLVISEGVETIMGYAFDGCSGLTGSLSLPSSLMYIYEYTFNNCSGLTGSLVIPEGVTTIGRGAFSNCRGFTGSLVIPEGVTGIGDNTFALCSGLTGSLVIPEGVTGIGYGAFMNCRGFTGSLVIPEGVTTIGEEAFRGCSGLEGDLSIPDNVKTVGNYAFSNCDGINNVEVSAGVEELGNLFGKSSDQTHKGGIKTVTVLGKETAIPNGLADIFVRGYSDSVVGREASNWNYTFIPIDAPDVTEHRVSTVQELLDAIGAAGEGSYRHIILADGTYNLSDTIELNRLVSVTLEAEHPGKAEIVAQDTSKPVISVNQCADVNIAGCILSYESETEESGAAAEFVQVQGSYDVQVKLYDQSVTANVSGVDMGVSVPMSTEEQKEFASDLAAQEGITVKEGEEVTVEITVSNAEDTLPAQDRQIVDRFAAAEKCEIGQYLDITMIIQAGSDRKPVSHTNKQLRLVMDIPMELRQAGRVFFVIRLHEGVAALLSDLDENPDTITIETDRFSAYTMAYKENSDSCSHTLTKIDAVPPTCGEDGNIEYYSCDKCGKKFADVAGTEEITDVTDSATGQHGDTEVRGAAAATQEQEGYTGDTYCKVCGNKIAEGTTIEKLSHIHETGGAWNSDGANHWKICTVCGKEFDKNAHVFTWVTDKAATEDETGLSHEECVCGAKRSEGTVIDILDAGKEEEDENHDGAGNSDDAAASDPQNRPTTSPNTGKERVERIESIKRIPALQIGLILAACTILGAGLWLGQRKRERKG